MHEKEIIENRGECELRLVDCPVFFLLANIRDYDKMSVAAIVLAQIAITRKKHGAAGDMKKCDNQIFINL